ncbi:MAG: hypothetical protein ACHQQ3_12985, partial [Gemmatimonadales bacterium]
TMETGLAKLRALETTGLVSPEEIRDIRWRNAARIFSPDAFKSLIPSSTDSRPSTPDSRPR